MKTKSKAPPRATLAAVAIAVPVAANVVAVAAEKPALPSALLAHPALLAPKAKPLVCPAPCRARAPMVSRCRSFRPKLLANLKFTRSTTKSKPRLSLPCRPTLITMTNPLLPWLANPELLEKIVLPVKIVLLAKLALLGKIVAPPAKPVAQGMIVALANLVVTTTAAAVETVAGIVVAATGTVSREKKARE